MHEGEPHLSEETNMKTREDYRFSEMIEIYRGESEKIIAAKSANRRHYSASPFAVWELENSSSRDTE